MDRKRLVWLTVLLVALLLGGRALAEGGYEVSWWTVDTGGTSFDAGGNYALGGTAAQADAGRQAGGGYSVSGGFWTSVTVPPVIDFWDIGQPGGCIGLITFEGRAHGGTGALGWSVSFSDGGTASGSGPIKGTYKPSDPNCSGTFSAVLTVTDAAGCTDAESSSLGPQTTVVLQQGLDGYLDNKDTFIVMYPPEGNYCSDPLLQVGYKQQYSAWIRFGLGAIPADASISSGRLRLYAVGWTPGNIGIQAFAVLRGVAPCIANWTLGNTGKPWNVAGCNGVGTDRRGTAAASFVTAGINTWYQLDLTSLVREWVSGSQANFGLLLRSDSASNVGIYFFCSAQHSDAAKRPKLVITYR